MINDSFIITWPFLFFRYYKDDRAVQEDKELEDFLNELSLNGTGENGGIGRVSISIPINISTFTACINP